MFSVADMLLFVFVISAVIVATVVLGVKVDDFVKTQLNKTLPSGKDEHETDPGIG